MHLDCIASIQMKQVRATDGSLPYSFPFLALVLILKAFTERGDARRAWILIFSSQFFIALSIALNKQFEFNQILIYLSGGIISADRWIRLSA